MEKERDIQMSGETQLVSVIVPVYNVEKYLEKCLESIAKQSYKNLQIILVDDGSTDASPQICDAFANRDNRVVVYHNENHGPGYSRNYGIDRSEGDLIMFVDSDDWVDEDYVMDLVQAITETESDIAISPYYFEFPDKSVPDVADKTKLTGVLAKDLVKLYGLTAGPCFKLYRRDIILNKGIRFPFNKSYSEDRVFNYYYLQNVKKYTYVDIPQYHYRQSEGLGLSKQKSERAFDDAMYALEEEKKFLSAMRAKRRHEMLYRSALGYLSVFRETSETGDGYAGFRMRFQRAKEIVPVAYSFKSLRTTIISCLYILNLPGVFYVWNRWKYYRIRSKTEHEAPRKG